MLMLQCIVDFHDPFLSIPGSLKEPPLALERARTNWSSVFTVHFRKHNIKVGTCGNGSVTQELVSLFPMPFSRKAKSLAYSVTMFPIKTV